MRFSDLTLTLLLTVTLLLWELADYRSERGFRRVRFTGQQIHQLHSALDRYRSLVEFLAPFLVDTATNLRPHAWLYAEQTVRYLPDLFNDLEL